MEFVLITGPPAVGKMAVGIELAAMTGFRLFHNHTSIEPVLTVFDFGTPEFWQVVDGFRRSVFATAAPSDLKGLIFTFVWAFDQEGDRRFVDEVYHTFVDAGARVSFVELEADLQERLRRADTQLRLDRKPAHRNVESMRQYIREADSKYRMNSQDDFPYPERHLKIANDDMSAEDVARRIVTHFGFVSPHTSPELAGNDPENS